MSVRLPSQDNVDQDDPEERHAWAFVALPGFGETPFMTPVQLLRPWSKHFDELGYVHGPTLAALADENGYIHVDQLPDQTKKLQMPVRGPHTVFNGLVDWVPMDTPEPEPLRIQDPAAMTVFEKEAQLERYRYLGDLPEREPARDLAGVPEPGPVGPPFDPTAHTPAVVHYHMSISSPAEQRRVIAAEMSSAKPRSAILNKYRGI
ncbi:phage gene 29 protein family protein [Rhodococcus sp. NPDC003994]